MIKGAYREGGEAVGGLNSTLESSLGIVTFSPRKVVVIEDSKE